MRFAPGFQTFLKMINLSAADGWSLLCDYHGWLSSLRFPRRQPDHIKTHYIESCSLAESTRMSS
jgi:hypothetical protein